MRMSRPERPKTKTKKSGREKPASRRQARSVWNAVTERTKNMVSKGTLPLTTTSTSKAEQGGVSTV